MTVYFVRKTGDDDNAGTSPATAWATIGKALGAAGIASGDTVYIGAGVYRECVTVEMTSATAETRVIGDVDGAQTGDAGEVVWTIYTTNDTTAPGTTLALDLNGRDYLTFKTITFMGCISAYTTTSQYITVRKCLIVGVDNVDEGIAWQGGTDEVAHWLVSQCVFVQPWLGTCLYIINNAITGAADLDLDFVVENCLFLLSNGAHGITQQTADATYNKGGVKVYGTTFWGGSTQIFSSGKMSSTYPLLVYNCMLLGSTKAVSGTNMGYATGDYNYATDNYFLGNDGGHSITYTAYAMLLQFGQEFLYGLTPRPLMSPMANSPFLGFGNGAGVSATDFLGKARPAGGQLTKAVGYMERHDTAIKETTVYDVTPGIKIVGPGDHEFQIPVDATSTTISVKARYDADHAATNKPQAVLLANPALGVTAETLTMSAAVDTWEALTFAAQTPTSKGVVKVRLISRAAAGNGCAFFDTFAVT
jgi:hypothetical protein